MKVLDSLHEHLVLDRRAHRLAELLSDVVAPHSTVLDVGSGDGQVASLLVRRRPDIEVQGVDLDVRKDTSIPVTKFDGQNLPYPDASFDTVLFVDVLHHTTDPRILLREAVRVARRSVVLKDLILQGVCAGTRLRFMDYVGNARHGVALPFNYWTLEQWREAEQQLGLKKTAEHRKLNLYSWPAEYIFGAGLHFIARYDIPQLPSNS
jgi:SAM-dependent methyltransferase